MSKRTFTVPLVLILSALASVAQSTVVHAPSTVTAGSSFSVSTTGNGSATFYLLGPSHVVKRTIQLGDEVQIAGADVTASGSYQSIVCGSSGCATADFQVVPSAPGHLSFLVHPSRVPVATANAINATALVFDGFHNTVLAPTKVEFQLSSAGAATERRSVTAVHGIAWFQVGSGAKQGPLKVVASVGDVTEPRIIQQVASDACGLRMRAIPIPRGVKLETDPIRDCSGNALPDGTVVSFTKIDHGGRSTVDVPIKQGVARTQFPLSGPARISLACGVVLGNELSVGGSR